MTTVNLSNKIKAIASAIKKGFVIDNDKDLDENYSDALDHLYANHPKQLTLIVGEASRAGTGTYLCGALPCSGYYWVQGDISFNKKKGRYEDVVQDEDGKCYLLVAK